ncbi:MAG: Ubiquinone biosynthesis monooxygenase UbiB [uncultured Sulfurovum sp.]|uniref:Ubiquinone biosynthesis monooxygenase UbiB n=1 Tax=uncultured Sulfurovum sp. TaxID=269237 RepID=A0A6S6S6R1_9BACT|nr:MAG: Ubiquinone biosynthesis monooxygenase UbiB [uncultured Sulfurovum sp.]
MTNNHLEETLQKKIPLSKLSRGRVAGKAMLKIGVVSGKGAVKRAFLSKENKVLSKSETHAQIAKVLMDSLGELKGVSVKIAQQIALGLPFLPKEYLEEISKSFNAIPPINKALIRKIIKQELGDYPQSLFDTFESNAFGAASLGQVHKATLNKKVLAVKVQYPGIASSIVSDLSVINFGLKRFAKGQNVDHLMQELEERLSEEVDYVLEAENTNYYAEELTHELIVIPRVVESLSTKSILTSTFLEGQSFDAFLKSNPTQAVRNHYAQLIFDSFFMGLYQLKMIHADPNPGNFIFMAKKKLGMIDFGCVKRVNENFLKDFSKLHVLLMDKASDEEITQQYVIVEMIDQAEKEAMLAFYQSVIKPLDRIYIEIFEEKKYDFKQNSDFSRRGFNTIMEVQKKQRHAVHKMNADYLFIDRTLLGYYNMFEKMEATIDTRFAQQLVREGMYHEND